jgi:SAM-dependent methyltransferase
MNPSIAAPRALVILLALLVASHVVLAQRTLSQSGEYTPSVGQPGKDVIWLPTPDAVVERMLRMAGVGSRDYVIDLGSGDGRTVIMAAEKFGARGLGIEYNPDMVALSIRNAELAGVTHKTKFVEGDIFKSNFSQATVITMYLLPSLNLKLRPKILDLRPGTRVVSHSFDMAEWQPDQTITVGDSKAHLWIVPTDVAGSWKLTLSTERGEETWPLKLDQDFQMLYGRVGLPEGSLRLLDGRIRGTEIRFHFIDASGNRREVSGSASSDHMRGTLRNQDGTSLNWSAGREELSAGSP